MLLDGDTKKAAKILEVKREIERYTFFKRAIDLGITYGKKDLIFSDFLLFSLIKDELSG